MYLWVTCTLLQKMQYIRHTYTKDYEKLIYTRFVTRCNTQRYIVQVDVASADSPPALRRQSFSQCLRHVHLPFRLCSRSISPTWGTLELLSRFRTVWSFKETQNVSMLSINLTYDLLFSQWAKESRAETVRLCEWKWVEVSRRGNCDGNWRRNASKE